MNVTIALSPLAEYALQCVCDAANAARQGEPPQTAEAYLQARAGDILTDYCRQYARISGAAFIDRFTAAEWAALKAARQASPQLAEAAAPLLQGQRVELAGPLAQGGVALLVQMGLLTSERAAAMLAPPTEGERV